jgi:cytochrome P450
MSRRLRIKYIEIKSRILRKYLRSRFFMGILRRYPRLAWLPGGGGWIRLVVHHDEAVRVFKQNRNYGVTYLKKMEELGAPFLLGLDKSPDHTRQRAALRGALEPVVLDQVVETTKRAADAALAGKTRIEVVRGLTDEVLRETIGQHLGTGKTSPEQLEAARMVFRHIFINPFNSPDVVDAAKVSALALLDHVRDIVAARRAEIQRGRKDRDDVLARLMDDMAHAKPDKRMKDDKELTDQLVGLVVAWSASVSRSTAYAIDALLDQPAALAQAHLAAKREDENEMWKLLAEAIRVQPPVPAVERMCLREGPVERMSVARERDVSIVLTAVTMDEGQYSGARRFDAERDPREQDNLAFGLDLHRCLGFDLASRQMSHIAIALMKRPNVQRAGKLRLAGPYPDRLEVTFEALR